MQFQIQHYILGIVALFSTLITTAQCDTSRYIHPIFDSLITYNDVKYGEAQVWYFPYSNTDLYMDIFEPEDDSLTKRPLMVWVHPGGFLTGDKSADDMVALCDSFARRGYVTATISYRLGFNPVSDESAERAVYRGVQDARAAIRYLKEHHLDYGIDTNYTFIGGSSAGGFSALHTAYLDQQEAPSAIEGTLTTPDLDCLDCDGNNYQHLIDIKGLVNLWGAVGDSSWIDANETEPALLIHGTDDGVVPYGVGHPFGVFTTPLVHGSRAVSNQMQSVDLTHQLIAFEGEDHEPHGTDNGTFVDPPNAYWDTIFEAVRDFYFDLLQPSASSLDGPLEVCIGDTVSYSVTIPQNHHICWETNATVINETTNSITVVWESSVSATLSYIQYSEVDAASQRTNSTIQLLEKPDASFDYTSNEGTFNFTPEELGNTNYIWDFGDGNSASNFSPVHTYQNAGVYEVSLTVVGSNGCSKTQTETIDLSTLAVQNAVFNDLKVFPNPTEDQITIDGMNKHFTIKVVTLNGKEVINNKNNFGTTVLDLQRIEKGTYFLHIKNASSSDVKVLRIVKM